MIEKNELPIHIENIESVTECWTYNRLTIVKNSPYYRDWIASHYNLYVDTKLYNFTFGENNKISPSYYEEILLRQPLCLFELTRDNVVMTLKEQLKNRYYLILFIKPYKDDDYFHEMLFYGYDDNEQNFLTVGLKDRQFQTITFQYSYIENTIEEVKNFFLNKQEYGMKLSLIYQYPFTAFKLNPAYDPVNCPFEAYKKLINELNGKVIFKNSIFEIDVYEDKEYAQIYTGINCLVAFRQVLQNEIRGNAFSPWFRGITSATKKLLEHRRMVKLSMEYLLEKWDKALNENAVSGAEDYSLCITTVEKWLNMCLKYEQSQDKALLERIFEEVPDALEKEKKSLESFVNHGVDWELFNKNYI